MGDRRPLHQAGKQGWGRDGMEQHGGEPLRSLLLIR